MELIWAAKTAAGTWVLLDFFTPLRPIMQVQSLHSHFVVRMQKARKVHGSSCQHFNIAFGMDRMASSKASIMLPIGLLPIHSPSTQRSETVRLMTKTRASLPTCLCTAQDHQRVAASVAVPEWISKHLLTPTCSVGPKTFFQFPNIELGPTVHGLQQTKTII